MLPYLAIAFGVAWACQIPVYAWHLDGPLALGLLAVGGVAPSAASLVVSRGAVWRELVRGPRPVWAVIAGLGGATVLSAVAGVATGTAAAGAPFLGSILLPPIGEELGWRGYLQPRLAARTGTLAASATVGVAWALWHAPTAIGHLAGFPPFALAVVLDSILIGWLWQRSGGSLVACVAAHAGLNLGLVRASATATLVVLAVAATLAGWQIRYAGSGSEPSWMPSNSTVDK